jgi:hypothetical protein
MTFNNRPVVDGEGMDSLGTVSTGEVVEFDVSTAITGNGIFSLAIDSMSTDGTGYSSREDSISPPELIISVNTNDVPVAVNDAGIVLEGGILTVTAPGLLSNDSDVNCNLVTVNTTPVNGPAHGTVALNADGSYEYIHDGSETVSDNFVYEISDGNGGTDTAVVTISVGKQMNDNFNDNIDNGWNHSSGTWLIENGLCSGFGGSGEIAISIVASSITTSAMFIEADYFSQQDGIKRNGLIIFDYQGPDDFKYAGAREDDDYWTVGYYNGNWNDVVTYYETIDTLERYRMRVEITGATVTLYVEDYNDGSGFISKVEFIYNIIGSGGVGLAADQSHAYFDNFEIYTNSFYYISPSGSDSNSGSESEPFRTIQKAADVVNPGDTVIVRDGTYYESVSLNSSGTFSSWITFKSENKGGAIIDGADINKYVIKLSESTHHIKIEGFRITGSYDTCVALSTAQHIVLYNNEIYEAGRNNCYSMPKGLNGVHMGLGSAYITIDSNVIYDNGRLAYGENGCNILTQNMYDHGVYVEGDHVTITNNIFYENQHGFAIQFVGGSNATVYNNTFADPNPVNIGQIVLWGDHDNMDIQNNIFYNPNDYAVWNFQGIKTNVVIRNNLIYSDIETVGIINSEEQGITLSDNIVMQDPHFMDAANRDYHLQSDSPAIDTGLPTVLKDIEGTARPQGSGYDIGAYEYLSGIP